MPKSRKISKSPSLESTAHIGVTTIDKLSEYDLRHIFSFLSFHDKARAAQVCRHWKSMIYQAPLWEGCFQKIKETADMEIMAPSLVERGITRVALKDVKSVNKSIYSSKTHSLLHMNRQLNSMIQIMAESLTVVNFDIVRPVGYRVVERILSVPMPKLEILCLGRHFQVQMEAIRNIIANCSNIKCLTILDCKDINNDAILQLGTDLKRLRRLAVLNGRNLTDEGFHKLTIHNPQLKALMACQTGLTDIGILCLAQLKSLDMLDLQGCRITSLCVDILSNARSKISRLKVSLCADNVLHRIGRSQLLLTHLTVGCAGCCKATDAGIDGLLKYGHKHYEHVQINGLSCISVDGMMKLAKRLDKLVVLKISNKDMTKEAKEAVANDK